MMRVTDVHELSCIAHTAYVGWTWILQDAESVGHILESPA